MDMTLVRFVEEIRKQNLALILSRPPRRAGLRAEVNLTNKPPAPHRKHFCSRALKRSTLTETPGRTISTENSADVNRMLT